MDAICGLSIFRGDERSQLNMAIASGEYDFISNGNFSDYYQQAAKGAFLDLNDYRDVVPELLHIMSLTGRTI